MTGNAIKINERDNVAVAARPLEKGSPVIVGGEHVVDTAEDIPLAHKVALAPISAGDMVIRYGEPIVEAVRDIAPGQWVHVHNTRPIPGDS